MTVTVRKCSRSLHRAIVEEGWNGIVVRNNIIILLILLTNKNKEGLSSLYPVSHTRMRSYSVFSAPFHNAGVSAKGKDGRPGRTDLRLSATGMGCAPSHAKPRRVVITTWSFVQRPGRTSRAGPLRFSPACWKAFWPTSSPKFWANIFTVSAVFLFRRRAKLCCFFIV